MRALTWALLCSGGISAHLMHPRHIAPEDDGNPLIDYNTQRSFDKADEKALEPAFPDTAIAAIQDHTTTHPSKKEDYDFARRVFRLAKRQEGGKPSTNSTVVSPATTSVTTEPESVTPSTSSSSAVVTPPSSIPSGGGSPASTSSVVALSSSESVHPSAAVTVTSTIASTITSITISFSTRTALNTLTPSGGEVVEQSPTSYSPTTSTSTSTVIVPASSTMTQTVTSTRPATSTPTVTSPTTTTISTSITPTAISTETKTLTSSTSSSSGSAAASSSSSSSSSSSISSEQSSSSISISESSGVTAGVGQPSFVLVTSTLSDGEPVTLTSFVGAPTNTNSGQGGTSTAPTGSLQSPVGNSARRRWSIDVGIILTVLVMGALF